MPIARYARQCAANDGTSRTDERDRNSGECQRDARLASQIGPSVGTANANERERPTHSAARLAESRNILTRARNNRKSQRRWQTLTRYFSMPGKVGWPWPACARSCSSSHGFRHKPPP